MSKTVIKLDEGWRAYLDSLGANAGFVEGLIHQYLEDPAQVDERWRRTFDGVASARKPNGGQPAVALRNPLQRHDHGKPRCEAYPSLKPQRSWTRPVRSCRLHGAAAKIAENMQAKSPGSHRHFATAHSGQGHR